MSDEFVYKKAEKIAANWGLDDKDRIKDASIRSAIIEAIRAGILSGTKRNKVGFWSY